MSSMRQRPQGIASRRVLAVSFFAGLAAFQVRADVRLDCGTDVLKDIEAVAGPNLDREVYGVRARDWQPGTVEEWQRQALGCIEGRREWGDSLKESMRQAVRATATRIKATAFENRKEALRTEATRQAIGTQGLNQITLYADGKPQEVDVRYPGRQPSVTFNCTSIRKGIGFALIESYRQAAAFAQMCVESGQLNTQTAALLARQAQGINTLYSSLTAFTASVDAAAGRPATEAVVRDLRAQADRLSASIEAFGLKPQESPLGSTQTKISTMQRQLDAKACEATYAKTGMPEKWRRNFVLLGPGEPMELSALVCKASGSGAQVRYLSGGLLSKEGFEVRSPNRTVQIFSELQAIPGGDPAVKVMVPVQAQAFGKMVEIDRASLRAVVVELATAIANK